MPEREVRFIGVESCVLQRIRVELGVQPDAPSLLPEVQQVAARVGDPLDSFSQLRPAVASSAAEHVAGEALAVRTDQRHRPRPARTERRGPITEPEGEVLVAVEESVEAEHPGRRGVSVAEAER